jgi:hypothetical protein
MSTTALLLHTQLPLTAGTHNTAVHKDRGAVHDTVVPRTHSPFHTLALLLQSHDRLQRCCLTVALTAAVARGRVQRHGHRACALLPHSSKEVALLQNCTAPQPS